MGMNPLNWGNNIEAVFLKAVCYYFLSACMPVGYFISSFAGNFELGFYPFGPCEGIFWLLVGFVGLVPFLVVLLFLVDANLSTFGSDVDPLDSSFSSLLHNAPI